VLQAGLVNKVRPYLKNSKHKKDWQNGVSGRVYASQTQSLQYCQKRKKRKKKGYVSI
jgi:hypothetical protein